MAAAVPLARRGRVPGRSPRSRTTPGTSLPGRASVPCSSRSPAGAAVPSRQAWTDWSAARSPALALDSTVLAVDVPGALEPARIPVGHGPSTATVDDRDGLAAGQPAPLWMGLACLTPVPSDRTIVRGLPPELFGPCGRPSLPSRGAPPVRPWAARPAPAGDVAGPCHRPEPCRSDSAGGTRRPGLSTVDSAANATQARRCHAGARALLAPNVHNGDIHPVWTMSSSETWRRGAGSWERL